MDDIEIQIGRIFERYRSAVHARDIEAFIALYSRDVRVFDTWGIWSYEDASAWRNAVSQWFTSIAKEAEETVTVNANDIRIAGVTDLASASAIVTYAAISATGRTLRRMQNRLTWTLARQGGNWLIVHEHTSMPVTPDDMHALTAIST